MKKLVLPLAGLILLNACTPCDGVVCTQELRMITVVVENPSQPGISLDSSYTVRQSNGQKIHYDQQMGNGHYIVLDDSYHFQLKNSEDDFRFIGWKDGQITVNEMYRIGADDCHIFKKSGPDTVILP